MGKLRRHGSGTLRDLRQRFQPKQQPEAPTADDYLRQADVLEAIGHACLAG